MKTVIQVWTNKCINKKFDPNDSSTYWGIGDLIRGTIKLYQLSRIMKFELLVDINLHPVSNFLEKSKHSYTSHVINNQDTIEFLYTHDLKSGLCDRLKSNYEIILLSTNDEVATTCPITDDCKQFIKSNLTPNPEFKQYLDTIISNLPFKEYNILHLRLGDNELVKKKKALHDYKSFIDKFIETKMFNPITDIIITDSQTLKTYLQTNTQIYTPDTQLCHIGLAQNLEPVRDTLVEFFITTHSKKITSFSIYTWVSNFVLWTSKIYDIPLISVKNT
jgi:hypothetical protein